MKEINIKISTIATYQEQLTSIGNNPTSMKDLWLEIFGLSADDGFTVEVGEYSVSFHYWEICHKGRVLFHMHSYYGSDSNLKDEIWIYLGPKFVDYYANGTLSVNLLIFDNNLVVSYMQVSMSSTYGINGGVTILPPCKIPLEYGENRYDMYSVGIDNAGVLGAVDFHGQIDGNRQINIQLNDYFMDVVLPNYSSPTRNTRSNSALVLRDFSLCGSNMVPHVVEDMWFINCMPTVLLTQKFIKLNGTKHMIIRSISTNQNSWFLLANTGEAYEGSNENNCW